VISALIILPNEADLDLLGAAFCLKKLFPEAAIVYPKRIAPNAWDMVRRAEWFVSIPAWRVNWREVTTAHFLGVQSPKNIPELIKHFSQFEGEIFVYSHQPPAFPFQVDFRKLVAQSFTAHFLAAFPRLKEGLSAEEAVLLKMAVVEKTWAGLNSKTTPADLAALEFFSKFEISTKQVANQVVLGLREGQRGLLKDLSQNIQDLEVNDLPVSLVVVRSIGNVQELGQVMDSLWSREDPYILVAGIVSIGKTHVWARSRALHVDLLQCFKDLNPRTENRWVVFSLGDREPGTVKALLMKFLEKGLVSEPVARQIMISPPQCIDEQASVASALDQMLKFNLMGLVVTRQGDFAGVITRRDLDRAVRMEIRDSPIAPFVPATSVYATPDMPVRVVKQLMAHHNVTRIPVVKDRKAIGILTSRELIRSLPDALPIPRCYLPLARSSKLPEPAFMNALVKRVTNLRIFHLLRKIGERAGECGLQAYLVGGVVRDILLERTNLDMDIVIIGDAIPFAKKLQDDFKAKLRVFEQFHTARLTFDDLKIDFSSARIEHYARVGALPQVEFSGLSNDLFRRDFTINALALDLRPDRFMELKDFFGGYEDLLRKQIRILHSFSFLEDPTRIFRAIRFATRFHFQLAEDTKRALDIALNRGALGKLSMMRIVAEVIRCFHEEQPYAPIQKFLDLGLLKTLHKDLFGASILPSRFKLIPGVVRRFSALREPINSEAIHWIGILARLPVSEADALLKEACYHSESRKIVIRALDAMNTIPKNLSRLKPGDDFGVFKLLRDVPIEGLISLILFALDKVGAKRIFDFIGRLRSIKCDISGKELIELGIPPGSHFSRIFEDILKNKIEGRITDKEGELEYARRVSQNLHLS